MPKAKQVERTELDPTFTGSSLPYILTVLGPKGGAGKTLLARTAICRYRAAGISPRIVQIDKTPALPDLYGTGVIALSLPSTEAQRADPLAVVTALEPYAEAIDASLLDGRPTVADVGSGPTATAVADFIGRTRTDAHVAGRAHPSCSFPWWPITPPWRRRSGSG